MKRCPRCQETYTGEAIKFCRLDGAPLQLINSSPAESSDTLALHAKDARDTLPTQLLKIYATMNEKELAFTWLERGLAVRAIAVFYKDEPVWDSMRNDPRFADLLQRMGIP